MSDSSSSFVSEVSVDNDDDDYLLDEDYIEQIFQTQFILKQVFGSDVKPTDEVLLRYSADYGDSFFVSERQGVQALTAKYRSLTKAPSLIGDLRNYVVQRLFAFSEVELCYLMDDEMKIQAKPFSIWISQKEGVIVTPSLLKAATTYFTNVANYCDHLNEGLKLLALEQASSFQLSLGQLAEAFKERVQYLLVFKQSKRFDLLFCDWRQDYQRIFNQVIEFMVMNQQDNARLQEYFKTFYVYQNEFQVSPEAREFLQRRGIVQGKLDLEQLRKAIYTEAAQCEKRSSDYSLAVSSLEQAINNLLIGAEAVEITRLCRKLLPLFDLSDDKRNVFLEDERVAQKFSRQERVPEVLAYRIHQAVTEYLLIQIGFEESNCLIRPQRTEFGVAIEEYLRNSVKLLSVLPLMNHKNYIKRMNDKMGEFVQKMQANNIFKAMEVAESHTFGEVFEQYLIEFNQTPQEALKKLPSYARVTKSYFDRGIAEVVQMVLDSIKTYVVDHCIEDPIQFVLQNVKRAGDVNSYLRDQLNSKLSDEVFQMIYQIWLSKLYIDTSFKMNQFQEVTQFMSEQQSDSNNLLVYEAEVKGAISDMLELIVGQNPALQQLQTVFMLKFGQVSVMPVNQTELKVAPQKMYNALLKENPDLEGTFQLQKLSQAYDASDPFAETIFLQNKPLKFFTRQFAKAGNRYQFLLVKEMFEENSKFKVIFDSSPEHHFSIFNVTFEDRLQDTRNLVIMQNGFTRMQTLLKAETDKLLMSYLESDQLSMLEADVYQQISQTASQPAFQPRLFKRENTETDSFTTPTKLVYPFVDVSDDTVSEQDQRQFLAAINNYRIAVCIPPKVKKVKIGEIMADNMTTFVVLDSQGRYVSHLELPCYDLAMPNPINDKTLEQQLDELLRQYCSSSDIGDATDVPKEKLLDIIKQYLSQFKESSGQIQRLLDEATLHDFLCTYGVCAVSMLITTFDSQKIFQNLENTLKYLNLPYPKLYYDEEGKINDLTVYRTCAIVPKKGKNAIIGKNLFFVNDLFFRRSFRAQHIQSILLTKILPEVPLALLNVPEALRFDYNFDSVAVKTYFDEGEFEKFQEDFGRYPLSIIEQLISMNVIEKNRRNQMVDQVRQKQYAQLNRFKVQGNVDSDFQNYMVYDVPEFQENNAAQFKRFEERTPCGIPMQTPQVQLFNQIVQLGIWAGRFILNPLAAISVLTLGGQSMQNLLQLNIHYLLPQLAPIHTQTYLLEVMPYSNQQRFYRKVKLQFEEVAFFALQVQTCAANIDFNRMFVSPHFTYQTVLLPQLEPRKLLRIVKSLPTGTKKSHIHRPSFENYMGYIKTVVQEQYLQQLEQLLQNQGFRNRESLDDKTEQVSLALVANKKEQIKELEDAGGFILQSLESEFKQESDITNFHLTSKNNLYDIIFEIVLGEVLLQKLAWSKGVNEEEDRRQEVVDFVKTFKQNEQISLLVKQVQSQLSVFEHMSSIYQIIYEQQLVGDFVPEMQQLQKVSGVDLISVNYSLLNDLKLENTKDLRILQLINILCLNKVDAVKQHLFDEVAVSLLSLPDLLLIAKVTQQRADTISQNIVITKEVFQTLPGSPYATPFDMDYSTDTYFKKMPNVLFNCIQKLCKYHSQQFNPEKFSLVIQPSIKFIQDEIIDRSCDPRPQINKMMVPVYFNQYGYFKRTENEEVSLENSDDEIEDQPSKKKQKRNEKEVSINYHCTQVDNSTIKGLTWFDEVCLNRKQKSLAQFIVYFIMNFQRKYVNIKQDDLFVGIEATHVQLLEVEQLLLLLKRLKDDGKISFDESQLLFNQKQEDFAYLLRDIINFVFDPQSFEGGQIISKYDILLRSINQTEQNKVFYDDEFLITNQLNQFNQMSDTRQQMQLVDSLSVEGYLLFISRYYKFLSQIGYTPFDKFTENAQDEGEEMLNLQLLNDYYAFQKGDQKSGLKLKKEDFRNVQSLIKQYKLQAALKQAFYWLARFNLSFNSVFDESDYAIIYDKLANYFSEIVSQQNQIYRIDPMMYFASSCDIHNVKLLQRYQPFLVEINQNKKEFYKSGRFKGQFYEVVCQKYPNIKGTVPVGSLIDGVNSDSAFIAFLDIIDPESLEVSFATFINYTSQSVNQQLTRRMKITDLLGNLVENQWRSLILANIISNMLSLKDGIANNKIQMINGSEMYPVRLFKEQAPISTGMQIFSDSEHKQKLEQSKIIAKGEEVLLKRIYFSYNLLDAMCQQGRDPKSYSYLKRMAISQGFGLHVGTKQSLELSSISEETFAQLLQLSAVYLENFSQRIDDIQFTSLLSAVNDKFRESSIPNSSELQRYFNEFRKLVFPLETILFDNHYSYVQIPAMFNYLQSQDFSKTILDKVNVAIGKSMFQRQITHVSFLTQYQKMDDKQLAIKIGEKQWCTIAKENNYNELVLAILLKKKDIQDKQIFKLTIKETPELKPTRDGTIQVSELSQQLAIRPYAIFSDIQESKEDKVFESLDAIQKFYVEPLLDRLNQVFIHPHFANQQRVDQFKANKQTTYLLQLYDASTCQFKLCYREYAGHQHRSERLFIVPDGCVFRNKIFQWERIEDFIKLLSTLIKEASSNTNFKKLVQ